MRYLMLFLVSVGVAAHLVFIALFIVIRLHFDIPPRAFFRKVCNKFEVGIPEFLVTPLSAFPEIDQWYGQGASARRPSWTLGYDAKGRPVSSIGDGVVVVMGQRRIDVHDVSELESALSRAEPGDTITLFPGQYTIRAKYLPVARAGSAQRPIVLRAARLGDAIVEFDALEGFLVTAPFWVFENLVVRGVCEVHDDCEHGFHIVGDAHSIVIHNSRLEDFNAAIKGNGIDGAYPDDCLISGNTVFNRSVRDTSNPVTAIDVNGASGWVVRGNLIADYVKAGGNRTSYAAFFKQNSRNGVFEQNLVICEMKVRAPESDTVGLSFGGGGTSIETRRRYPGEEPAFEHSYGIMKNNIVLHCSESGIYLNRARDCDVFNNTLFATLGIDARFRESRAKVTNNLLSGRVKAWSGAGMEDVRNRVRIRNQEFTRWFRAPEVADFSLVSESVGFGKGVPIEGLDKDFCGNPRSGDLPDLGAIEYSAGTSPCNPSAMSQQEASPR